MRNVLSRARALLRDESGQDLAEYGLLMLLIAVALIVTVRDVGGHFNDFWTIIVDQFEELL